MVTFVYHPIGLADIPQFLIIKKKSIRVV